MKKKILLFLLVCSCKVSYAIDNSFHNFLETLREKYNTKMNAALIDLNYTISGDTIWYRGAVSDSLIYKDIQKTQNVDNFSVQLDIVVLPGANSNNTEYGIVNVSVADVHSSNKFTSSLTTQELLGTPVPILEEKDGWYRVQCSNKYYGWISAKQVVKLTREKYENWKQQKKIICTNTYGKVFKSAYEDQSIVSDFVENDILSYIEEVDIFYKVSYPDGRIGYVKKTDAIFLNEFIKIKRNPTVTDLIESIMAIQGIPYIWGGTSTKGIDCSGLICSIFRSNGLFIYRDASQQAMVGKAIELTPDYGNLRPGDLVFFGKENNIRHVGFYLGNKIFIHSSGFVKISSLDPNDINYDEFNTKELIEVRRYIDHGNIDGAWKIDFSLF